jgi:chromosome segregation ATPase
MADTAELREELATVEDEIRELETSVEELRVPVDGPVDAAELAQRLTTREEQEALLENLRARRETLQARLGAA